MLLELILPLSLGGCLLSVVVRGSAFTDFFHTILIAAAVDDFLAVGRGDHSLLNVDKKFAALRVGTSSKRYISLGLSFPSAASHWGLPSSEEFPCPIFVLSRFCEMCVAVTTITTAWPHQTKHNDEIWRPRILSSLSGLELFLWELSFFVNWVCVV